MTLTSIQVHPIATKFVHILNDYLSPAKFGLIMSGCQVRTIKYLAVLPLLATRLRREKMPAQRMYLQRVRQHQQHQQNLCHVHSTKTTMLSHVAFVSGIVLLWICIGRSHRARGLLPSFLPQQPLPSRGPQALHHRLPVLHPPQANKPPGLHERPVRVHKTSRWSQGTK